MAEEETHFIFLLILFFLKVHLKKLFKDAHIFFIFFYMSLSINLYKQTLDQQGKNMLRSGGTFCNELDMDCRGQSHKRISGDDGEIIPDPDGKIDRQTVPLVVLHQNLPHLRLGFLWCASNLETVVNGKASGIQNLEEVYLGKSFGILEANKQSKEKRGGRKP